MALYRNLHELRLAKKKPGDEIYAYALEMTRDQTKVRRYAKPVKGMLAASQYPDSTLLPSQASVIRYFVPERADGQGYVWSKAIDVHARMYADDMPSAKAAYETLVDSTAEWLEQRAADVRALK